MRFSLNVLFYSFFVSGSIYAENVGVRVSIEKANPSTASSTVPTSTGNDDWEEEYQKRESRMLEKLSKEELCFSGEDRSPVDINIGKTIPIYVSGLEFVNYNTKGEIKEVQSDHTEALGGFNNWKNPPFVRGGTLEGEYVLWEYHQNFYHGMAVYSSPFEINYGTVGHSINGANHEYEAHLIHVKRGITLEEAKGVPGAIAIVAVQYKRNSDPHPYFTGETGRADFSNTTIISERKTQTGTIMEFDNPSQLIPNDTTSFITYNGSLAHAPCPRGVIWNLLVQPVSISAVIIDRLTLGKYKTNYVAKYMTDPPIVGNRKVFFNFGTEKQPSVAVDHVSESPSFAMVILLLTIVGLTIAANMAVRKYRHKIVPEKTEVQSFFNNNFELENRNLFVEVDLFSL